MSNNNVIKDTLKENQSIKGWAKKKRLEDIPSESSPIGTPREEISHPLMDSFDENNKENQLTNSENETKNSGSKAQDIYTPYFKEYKILIE